MLQLMILMIILVKQKKAVLFLLNQKKTRNWLSLSYNADENFPCYANKT